MPAGSSFAEASTVAEAMVDRSEDGCRRSQGGEFVVVGEVFLVFNFFVGGFFESLVVVVVVIDFGFGFGFGGGKAVVFVEVELGFAAEVEGVLEAGKFADEVLQTEGTFLGIFDGPKCGDALADFDDEYPAHGFEGVVALVVLGEFGFVLAEVIEPLEALLLLEPIDVAAFFPFGEVLGADGFAFELFGQDSFGSG